MGRKSSAKDRAYITQSERKDGYGSVRDNHAASSSAASSSAARRAALVSLPFTHCRLTCEPWVDPVCSPDGDVFDVTAAVPALRANAGRNPLTGEALALRDLVRLRFHRLGGGGEGPAPFGCPVTGRAFTPSSHIVAVRPTGNVFSFEAVERLCLRPRNFRDLLDDTEFRGRGDLIHLQDPSDASGTAAARAERLARAVAGGGAAGAALAASAAAASDEDPSSGLDRSALGRDAQRILARLASGAGGAAGPGAAPAGGRGDRGASRLPGSDPRLRAPERERVAAPSFKAGAATWDTAGDDSSQPQQLSFQMRKDAERRRRREEAEEEAVKVREANRRVRSGEEKRAPAPYGERVFERLAAAAKARAAASSRPVAFTSSVTALAAPPLAASDLPRPPRLRRPTAERGYCRLRTSLGDLNLELFASAAPRAVENFVVLAKSGYYDGCVFHRSVRNFCAQSGVRGFFFRSPPFFFPPPGGPLSSSSEAGGWGERLTPSLPLVCQPRFDSANSTTTTKKTGPDGHGPRRGVCLRRPLPLRGPRGGEELPRRSEWRRWRKQTFRFRSRSFSLLPRRPRGARHGQLGRPRRQRLPVLPALQVGEAFRRQAHRLRPRRRRRRDPGRHRICADR